MFRSPQANLYTRDMPRLQAFYRQIGFVETFRYPHDGLPEHMELRLDGFTLGIATEETARANHGLAPDLAGHSAELVLRTDDVDAAIGVLARRGAAVLAPAHD